jgi:hypothetical protein
MASQMTIGDVLSKEMERDFSARSATAEMMLLIIANGDNWASNPGVVAKLLYLMGYIAGEVLKSENVHRALRPEFERIVEAADL